MINYQHNELILEFTGKILLDKYPSLINRDNIKDCLSEINKLDICSLDTDAIIQDSEVVKCDVTKDVEFEYIDKILKISDQTLRTTINGKINPIVVKKA